MDRQKREIIQFALFLHPLHQQNTCGNYVVILKTDEDCSVNSVGMRGGVQRIKLGGSCMSYKGIQHEMLHALGVEHEHQRPDRFEVGYCSYRI